MAQWLRQKRGNQMAYLLRLCINSIHLAHGRVVKTEERESNGSLTKAMYQKSLLLLVIIGVLCKLLSAPSSDSSNGYFVE